MLKVYVCEDNVEQRNRIVGFIKDVMAFEGIELDIAKVSGNPYDLLEKVRKNGETGLYFLDVDLKTELNGIKLAAEIREYDPSGFIVFITTHAEMSYLTFTYKVEAMDYIIKDNYEDIKKKITDCVLNANKRYLNKETEKTKNFTIKSDDKIINIKFNDILFFETSDTIHKVKIHAINRQVEFYAKMKDIEELLDERFVRCHRAYIVNKENIAEVDKKNKIAYMVNGEKCYLAFRSIKSL